jgi:urate oxidase
MSKLILAQNQGISSVSYSLPNKHYIPFDLSKLGYDVKLDESGKVVNKGSVRGLDNGLSRAGGAEVFFPVSAPSGLITATVSRKDVPSAKL